MSQEKKKILIFSLAYHPFVGGAEVAIKEITDRLGDSFDFDMITVNLDGRQKQKERMGNISIYRIGSGKLSKYLFPWTACRKAQQLNRDNSYDVIWAMMANQAGWAAMKFRKKNSRTKFLLTLQEGDSEWDIFWRTVIIRPIYENIYRRADYIQAISNFLANRARKMGAKCEIKVVPNGIDNKIIEKYLNTHEIKNKKNSPGKQIITASRLVRKNGIEYLIRAVKDLDVVLKICGDGKLRGKLEGVVRDLGINDRVTFCGEVNQFELFDLVAQSDVFIRPSLSEGLGNAFLEAMAVGVPVIGTKVGGIPDFLEEGKTGWFCEVKNPQSIAEKINYILDPANQQRVRDVVDNAREMVREKYNWDNIAREMKNIFNNL